MTNEEIDKRLKEMEERILSKIDSMNKPQASLAEKLGVGRWVMKINLIYGFMHHLQQYISMECIGI